jgi:hypothetical protein
MCLLDVITNRLEEHLARYIYMLILNITVECRYQMRVNLKEILQRYKGDDKNET